MRFTLALGLMLLAVLPARAEVPLDGLFTAATTCPAYQSINRQTNPGNVEIKTGEDYALIAGNREPPSHIAARNMCWP
jgi:ribonuclease T2